MCRESGIVRKDIANRETLVEVAALVGGHFFCPHIGPGYRTNGFKTPVFCNNCVWGTRLASSCSAVFAGEPRESIRNDGVGAPGKPLRESRLTSLSVRTFRWTKSKFSSAARLRKFPGTNMQRIGTLTVGCATQADKAACKLRNMQRLSKQSQGRKLAVGVRYVGYRVCKDLAARPALAISGSSKIKGEAWFE